MRIFNKCIKEKLTIYYAELNAIKREQIDDVCVYGSETEKTYKYQLLELRVSLLKCKIAFWELVIW